MERSMPGRDPLEVYISEAGNICIKQDAPYGMGEEDKVIVLEPSQVPTVIQWLHDCLKEVSGGKVDIIPSRDS